MNTHIDKYYLWLKERTFIEHEEHSDWLVISTPFMGAFNDDIEIYAKKEGDQLLLRDNGETLTNLELQGVKFQGSGIRRSLKTILKSL